MMNMRRCSNMTWMRVLYNTYEANKKLAGRTDITPVLCPVAHVIKKIKYEITIDENGKFLEAKVLGKDGEKTLIPATEASEGRTKEPAPYPISDNLDYVAGDFKDFDAKNASRDKKRFKLYESNLKHWAESENTNLKVKAIYKYVQKRCVIHDLIKSNIVSVKSLKANDMVRFRVVSADILNEIPSETWEDEALIKNFIKYYNKYKNQIDNNWEKENKDKSQLNSGICYILGEKENTVSNAPKNIIKGHPNAKLLSSDDKDNFTYRGRFEKAEEAFSVSYEASQKVHNALRWLDDKQGVSIGSKDKRTYIAWNPNGKKTIIKDMFFGEDDEEEDDETDSTGSYMRKKLYRGLNGNAEDFDPSDEIVVMGMDAATNGRGAVIYYNELMALDFWKRLEKWKNDATWFYYSYKGKQNIYGAPCLMMIVKCAYGTEQNKKFELNDKVLNSGIQFLMHCMIDGRHIPYDVVHALFTKACLPQSYEHNNYEMLLFTACAIIKKYKIDKGKGDVSMQLDLNETNRSYLFGRLLAVLEHVERCTYEEGEKREPNAIRLMNAFVNHPMKTWGILETMLLPYYQQLSPKSRAWHRNIIGEITEKLPDRSELKRPLDENYLLGYYLQRAELYKKKKDNSRTTTNNDYDGITGEE